MNGRGIIHPRGRFGCITSVRRFKFAKFEYTDSNVRKRPFPLAKPYKWLRWPLDSIDVLTHHSHVGLA